VKRLRITVAILAVAAVAGIAVGTVLFLQSREDTYRPGEEHEEITQVLARNLPEDAPSPAFVDVTADAGLADFSTFAGDRSSQLPEDMGCGAAFGDYDGDGDDDLFLVSTGGSLEAAPDTWAPSRLYENRGDGTFDPVPDFPEPRIIGMGASWGDYDGDGRLDLAVTGYNALLLFRNTDEGFVRHEEIASRPGFWTGVTWTDFDRDGDLDLYVCGYVRYQLEEGADLARTTRQYGAVVPFTLSPASFDPERNLLFRNEGGGRFSEVAAEVGVDNSEGRSLGALWHDFDDDGWPDLYVANDISDNALFLNNEGVFQDVSHAAWVADYRGAMGLAAADWNRDGDEDLFITHWVAQENALYDSLLTDLANRPPPPQPEGGDAPKSQPGPGGLRFMDVADSQGLGQIALQSVGWGSEFADLDADGWLDLVVVNGSTFETEEQPRRLKPQRPFLFWNRRGEYFHDLAPFAEPLAEDHVARGLATSDYDDDGDLDLLIVHLGEGVRLLRNDMEQGHWLKLRLRPRDSTAVVGTRVLARVGDTVLRRSVGNVSYLSQSSQTVHIGLGEASRLDELEVRWPRGGKTVLQGLEAGSTWEIVEGDTEPRRIGASRATAPQTHTELTGAGRTARERGGSRLPRVPGSEESSGQPAKSERERIVAFWTAHRAAMDTLKIDKDVERAMELFREALSYNPNHEDALYYLATCLSQTGDIDGALERLDQLTRVNPQSHRGWREWGSLKARYARSPDDLRAAAQAVERALDLNPEETGALLLLGEIALLLGDERLADQRLEWACRTNPRAVGGFFLLGYLAWRRGDEAEARRHLGSARAALGEEWKPEGTTAEGDIRHELAGEESPLSPFWEAWDGSDDPDRAYSALDDHLDE
jgi:tetratricopeptide (TPR) repeat protein